MFRQRPPEANGVMFLTLEDDTGIVNLVVWAQVLEACREATVTGDRGFGASASAPPSSRWKARSAGSTSW